MMRMDPALAFGYHAMTAEWKRFLCSHGNLERDVSGKLEICGACSFL
jgi:hypothetical protein